MRILYVYDYYIIIILHVRVRFTPANVIVVTIILALRAHVDVISRELKYEAHALLYALRIEISNGYQYLMF